MCVVVSRSIAGATDPMKPSHSISSSQVGALRRNLSWCELGGVIKWLQPELGVRGDDVTGNGMRGERIEEGGEGVWIW